MRDHQIAHLYVQHGQSVAEVKALHRIRHQSMQLLDLIQGVLDLNRLDARGLSISLQDVTVEQLLREVREDIPEAWARLLAGARIKNVSFAV